MAGRAGGDRPLSLSLFFLLIPFVSIPENIAELEEQLSKFSGTAAIDQAALDSFSASFKNGSLHETIEKLISERVPAERKSEGKEDRSAEKESALVDEEPKNHEEIEGKQAQEKSVRGPEIQADAVEIPLPNEEANGADLKPGNNQESKNQDTIFLADVLRKIWESKLEVIKSNAQIATRNIVF